MAGQAAERRRTGVITQKLGMSRVFNDAGEHVPVTVLRVDNCQVIAQRTQAQGGYVALQLGAGRVKVKNTTRAVRGHYAKARIEPKRHLFEFRVSEDALVDVGATLAADHFAAGQFVDAVGTSIGKGFAGGMKRHNFSGPAREPRRIRLAPRPRLDRPVPGPRQGVQGQEDGGPARERAGDRAEPRGRGDGCGARPHHGEGRRAGPEGRRRAAVGCEEAPPAGRRSVPGRAPGPSPSRKPAEEAEPEVEEGVAPEAEDDADGERRGGVLVKVDVIDFDAKKVGKIELADEVFGAAVRPDLMHRTVRWQLAKRRAGTHKTKSVAEIRGSTRKPFKQKGTGRARAGSRRAPHHRGGVAQFGPVLRDHAHKLPKKVRKLALKSALSSKQADGKLAIVDSLDLGSARTRVLAERLAGLGWSSALVIDGDEIDAGFARAARNLTGSSGAAPARRQRLRHSPPRSPGADPQGGGKPASEARMSVEPKERWYDTILGPVVTEKSTQGSENNQVTFRVRTDATKPQIKEAVEGLFEVKVKKVNTSVVKGKVKRSRRGRLGKRSDWKKATVSLGEGDTIDVMTGL